MVNDLTFGACEVHGLAVGAHGDQANKAGFAETDCVAADSSRTEFFGFGIEKGHSGSVDSGTKRGVRHHFGDVGHI